jgi:hypothetical protein
VPDTTGTITNDNGSSLYLHFILAAGSTYSSGTFTSNTWAATTQANRVPSSQANIADSTSNEWYVTGVQLEVGKFDSTSIPAFPFESFNNNLRKCQRYYEIAEGGFFGPVYGTASDMRVSVPFKVTKRANPTLTKISGEENCCSSTTVTGNSFDQTLGARTQGTNVFAAGASKFFNVKFSADSEL